MNVWIDLGHIPQYNFYRNLIVRLSQEGYHVYVTVLGRGKMPVIVKKELGGFSNIDIFIIGHHRMNKLSAIFEANLFRLFQLFFWKVGKKIDIALSNSYQSALICKCLDIPVYTFADDIRTYDYKFLPKITNEINYCIYKLPENAEVGQGAKIFPCLKEWSYLSPNVFEPNIDVLSEYNVNPKEYIFLREVSVGTLNYKDQATGAILNIQSYIPKDIKVLFSLEDKSTRNLYPKDWILLQEPLRDIHSLIYFATGLVSSGDSMAREASLLGIPAYYLGVRHSMPANLAASEVADFSSEADFPFTEWVPKLLQPKQLLIENQQNVRNQLLHRFKDINEYMYSLVLKHKVE